MRRWWIKSKEEGKLEGKVPKNEIIEVDGEGKKDEG